MSTLLPPNFGEPYSSSAERKEALGQLSRRDRALRSIETLAHKPASQWSLAELTSFPNQVGTSEHPSERVKRWKSLFAEELAEVHRLASTAPVSDVEVRHGVFLAGRLLMTVTGMSVNEIEDLHL